MVLPPPNRMWGLLLHHQLVAPALTPPSKILFTSAPCWEQLYELWLFNFCSDRDPFLLLFFMGNVFLEVKIVNCSGSQHPHWGSQGLCYFSSVFKGLQSSFNPGLDIFNITEQIANDNFHTNATALCPVFSFRSLKNILNTTEVTVHH